MELTQIVQPGRQVIERYAASGFRVSGAIYQSPVLVFPDLTLVWAEPALTADSLAPVIEHGGVEILLLGMGRRMGPVAPNLRAAFKANGIVIEAMDTGAACRTYNILLAEERRIAAALLPPV